MRIGILGGGSVGLLFAYYLSLHYQTTLYTRTNEQKEILNAEGLFLEKHGIKNHLMIKAQVFDDWAGQEDLTIVTVKQYQLESVMERIRTANANGSFLFLQNGMGHLDLIESLDGNNVFVGSVEHGTLRVDYNHVKHTGDGVTRIALYKGNNPSLLKELEGSFIHQFPFQYEDHYEEMLVNKLVVNSVINPLTAVLNVPNGELVRNPYYFELVKALFGEVKNVLSLHNEEKHFANIIKICQKTSMNHSSMLKDIEENRPTEIDAILGYLIKKALEKDLKIPLILAFYNGVKGKEHVGEGR